MGTLRLCRNGDFAQTTQTASNMIPHNGGNFHNFLQLICCVAVYWNFFVHQHGRLCKQTAKRYYKSVWGIFANPVLVNYLDRLNPH